jgi:CubicO group peptidase (beta-lactamase class C family)
MSIVRPNASWPSRAGVFSRAPWLLGVFLVLHAAVALPQGYQVGGSERLPDEFHEQLDAHVDLVRLGINTDRLMGAHLLPVPYVSGVLDVARAVRDGKVGGVLLHMDSFMGDNVPIGIGYMMTDPEKHNTDWSTFYEIGSLTGVLTTTPLTLRALERGDLTLADTVGQHVRALAQSNKAVLTVGDLLRHSSGLPSRVEVPHDVRTPEALLGWLAELPLDFPAGTAVRRSELNFLLLGLVLEGRYGIPIQEFAAEHYFKPLAMANTTGRLPDQLRSGCAPGQYSQWHGRMAWGEASDPTAFILGASAGHGGIVSSADDLDTFARTMILSWTVGLDDHASSETMQMSTRPQADLPGGADQGLGWALGGLGEGSFGWECPWTGSALWIHPQRQVFVILLANAHHPDNHPERFEPIRKRLLRCLRAAMPAVRDQANAPSPAAWGEERRVAQASTMR